MNKLNNAEVSLELCRTILAQQGQNSAYTALRGVELHTTAAASMALGILRSTQVYGAQSVQAKEQAIQALELATEMSTPHGDA